jgi:ribosomal protein S11
MRSSYQLPPSMSRSLQTPSRQGQTPNGANSLVSPQRWAEMNAMAGIEPSAATLLALPQQPPLYVIHVKSTSNNTIITLHATPTPKSQILSPKLSRDFKAQSTILSPAPFSVESNPDAAPQDQDTGASDLSQEGKSTLKVLSELANEPLRTPTSAELSPSSSFTPPTANRCIGWASGGSCHYKKVNRSTYEAGYAASVSLSDASTFDVF